MKKRYHLVAMLLIWTVLWSMIAGISGRVKASPNTVVKLTLQMEPPQVEVSPGSSGIVTLQGTVYCLKYGSDQVKVSLIGSTDLCEANVNPPNMVFGGNSGSEETRTFSITTRLPQGTPFSTTPQVMVSGHYIQGGVQYPISPMSHFIEILPYYKIYVEGPPPQDAFPGDFIYFPIKLTNCGNTEDTYEFNFNTYVGINSKRWATLAVVTPKTYSPKETKTVVCSLEVSEEEKPEGAEIRHLSLEIISQQSRDEGGSVKYLVPLYVRIKEHFIIPLIPSIILIGFITATMVFAGMVWDRNTKGRVRNT